MKKVLFLVISTSIIASCGASTTNLKNRASFDLDCPVDKLELVEIDRMTRGVRGCGKKLVYVTNCSNPLAASSNCTWLLNSTKKSE